MSSFKPTEIFKAPKVGAKVTEDTNYWKKLSFPVAIKDYGPINYIDIASEDPFPIAVTCSAKVQIYSPNTQQVAKTITRFNKAAYGGVFRRDGKLLLSGSEEGIVKLFDVQSKAQLRLFKGHNGPTHRCNFLDGNKVVSFSDDKTIGIWDIPGENRISSLTGHSDYIRAGVINPANHSIVISGSYDHSVKLFDIRSSECALTVDHGAPVESVAVFPTGNLFVSAGGTFVKVWDAVNGRLLVQLSQHHKTVTCLNFASNNSRLMSGSLDKQVKIYDTLNYQVVHTLQYPSPLLSLAIAAQDKFVVAGMADGLVSIRHMKTESKTKKEEIKPISSFKRYGNDYQKADVLVNHEKQIKLAGYDKLIKTFQMSRALDDALKVAGRTRKPQIAISVIQELIRRKALKSALAGRDAQSLAPIMKFVSRNLPDPTLSRILLDVATMLIDLYGPCLGESTNLCDQFEVLKLIMDKELKYMKDMMEVNGILQSVLSMTNSHVNSSFEQENMLT